MNCDKCSKTWGTNPQTCKVCKQNEKKVKVTMFKGYNEVSIKN